MPRRTAAQVVHAWMTQGMALDEPGAKFVRSPRRTRAPVIVGVDPSLTGAAAVALYETWTPGKWNLDRVRCGEPNLKKDTPLVERVARVDRVLDGLLAFIHRVGAQRVFIEEHSFGMSGGNSYAERVELVGALKRELRKTTGIIAVPVVASAARKYLVGKIRKTDGKVKDVVFAALQRADAPFATDDEADAFVVANYGRTELGFSGLVLHGGGS